MSIEAVIDYRNLRFMIKEDGKPVDLPIKDELKEKIIREIVEDCYQSFSRQILGAQQEPVDLQLNAVIVNSILAASV